MSVVSNLTTNDPFLVPYIYLVKLTSEKLNLEILKEKLVQIMIELNILITYALNYDWMIGVGIS